MAGLKRDVRDTDFRPRNTLVDQCGSLRVTQTLIGINEDGKTQIDVWVESLDSHLEIKLHHGKPKRPEQTQKVKEGRRNEK